MRSVMLFAWLMLPIAFGAYHYGPGQDQMILDETEAHLRAVRAFRQAGDDAQAAEQFDAALALMPTDRTAEIRTIRLEKAKAQMDSQQLPAAYDELTTLVKEMAADKSADPAVLADARHALGNAHYYMTWLMRLEGEPLENWEPEIEAARQNYRLLAEQTLAAGQSTVAQGHRQDLESAIRLARMDLSDLQALAIPSQCKGCCSGNCKCKGKGKSMQKKEGDKKARGASSGPPPDGAGS